MLFALLVFGAASAIAQGISGGVIGLVNNLGMSIGVAGHQGSGFVTLNLIIIVVLLTGALLRGVNLYRL